MRIELLAATFILCCVAPTWSLAQQDVSPIETIGTIEILDPAADSLIDSEAKIERLATGFKWSEGPVWISEGGFLVFSDVPQNTVFKWQEGKGLGVYLKPSGYTGEPIENREPGSNGLALDGEGRLLLCQHGDHRVAMMDAPVTSPEPKFITIAGDIDGKTFNSPNDLTVHSSGAIYFTDPPYGRPQGFDDPDRPLDYQGVYRVMPGEPAQLMTKELRAPNGIALSPDEKTLYVAQSDRDRPLYMAYPVQDDGTLGTGRVLLNVKRLADERPGSADGMKLDSNGNLFATGPGGVLIISPEGKHLATISTGDRIANCAFGDDGHTLYMTSNHDLCRVRVKAKGLGF
ncbi:SMP-30/gluconolactonase/LRE family protein [Aeoliella mucimassa]|uniref:Gluconolactonase n=1 Tax=Aeoliella mucimassa TaxID=2527972 RepID=A0A518AW78_9BACT|nr:SMP-30/gluconolactonase/LRE family protein [Aeoliella mucimassa]QDU58987.1 Gluconolactonase precursor [Aeoliella mucimassa]